MDSTSNRCNALGLTSSLITPNYRYEALGSDEIQRKTAYQVLFNAYKAGKTLYKVRMSANKAWVLGGDYFLRLKLPRS